jgi:hypothetical protein
MNEENDMSIRELTRDEIVRVSGGRGGNPAPTPTPQPTYYGRDGMPVPLDPPPGFTGFGDEIGSAGDLVRKLLTRLGAYLTPFF